LAEVKEDIFQIISQKNLWPVGGTLIPNNRRGKKNSWKTEH